MFVRLPLLLTLTMGILAPVFGEAPAVSAPSEPEEKNFNLGLRDGEQKDSFIRRIKHFYYNLSGEGAIRDGIRYQEEAILSQPTGRPDAVQSALHRATLEADAAAVEVYRGLRLSARGVQVAWNKALRARGDEKLLDESRRELRRAQEAFAAARRALPEMLVKIDRAAQWHAGSHQAAGGAKTANPTELALRNAAGAAQKATELAGKTLERAGRLVGGEAAGLEPMTEAETLPKLESFPTRVALGPEAGSVGPGSRLRLKKRRIHTLNIKTGTNFFD